MILLLDLARRYAAWIAIAILALVIVTVGPGMCRKQARETARARLGEEIARSASASGRDAVATVGAAARREADSADLTRTNEEEIRHAQGADVPVDPDVRDAGLDGLCRRPAYRDDERCRMRRAAPR